jgi:hypothetical protein
MSLASQRLHSRRGRIRVTQLSVRDLIVRIRREDKATQSMLKDADGWALTEHLPTELDSVRFLVPSSARWRV